MNDKKARQHAIRNIVATGSVTRQEQIVEMLLQQGFVCTQTMVSRDLRQMRISKVSTKDGRQLYVMPRESQFITPPTQQEIEAAKWYVMFSGNMAVLHTPPGHASLAAYNIDEHKNKDILGTIAGDDTVLVILAESTSREKAMATIREAVPMLKKTTHNRI